jgi:hypothetical protein
MHNAEAELRDAMIKLHGSTTDRTEEVAPILISHFPLYRQDESACEMLDVHPTFLARMYS